MSIRLADCKSTVKSQHGEDGVIAAVFREIGVSSRTCVEFGAYDMQRLSNVFPLWTNGWKCLLIEGDAERYRKLVSDFAAYPGSAELRVSIANGYVQEAGANSLDNILSKHEFPIDLDLVSIDVDGTDFHIWRGLRRYRPRLVIVEYNPMIPHHIDIVGSASGNDIGCSVRSLARLGKEKGYSLVACIGWNALEPMRGFKSFTTAATTLAGIELAHRIRNRQFICQSKDRRISLDRRREWYAAIIV